MKFSLIQGLRTVFRAIHIFASSLATQGTYLTSACNSGDTTLIVENTTDFAVSGSGQIIDSTNDRNGFTYTGKTANTLTGCVGVLAHNSGVTVIPLAKLMVIDSNVNEMRYFGNAGNNNFEEIADIGSTDVNGAVGTFGTADGLNIGVQGKSNTAPAVKGVSVLDYGGQFGGGAGQLQLIPGAATLPASPGLGDIYLDASGNPYVGKAGVGVTVLVASNAQSQESPDNTATWQVGNGLNNRAWSKPVWNGTVFCIVASGTQITATSADGITWTEHAGALPSSAAWGALVWNGAVFCTIELGVTSTKGATSADGITWAAKTIPSAIWADQTNLGTTLCIVGTSKSATSTNNGTNWTSASPAITFIKVGSNATLFIGCATGTIYSSTDGLNWTSRQTFQVGTFYDLSVFNNIICITGTATLVVDFHTFTYYGIWRSIDGISWTFQTSSFFTSLNISTATINQNDQQFIITLLSSTSAYTSTDGLTWTALTLPAASAWVGLTGYYTSGGWQSLNNQPIFDVTVTGAAVTSVTTDGVVMLDGLAHGGYRFAFDVKISGTLNLNLCANADTTTTNYNTNAGGGWANNASIIVNSNEERSYTGDISLSPQGYLTIRSSYMLTAANNNGSMFWRKNATVANLTRLDWLISTGAAGINVGSRFRLWRNK